jgi:hypothetical protein
MLKQSKYYICDFCYEQYVPTRRGAQKYCNNSCRSKAYHHRKQQVGLSKPETAKMIPLNDSNNDQISENNKTKVEQISMAGVGNAVLGTFAANVIKSITTNNEDKPATKGDLNHLALILKGRYHFVKNGEQLPNGKKPYFDMQTNTVVYLWDS